MNCSLEGSVATARKGGVSRIRACKLLRNNEQIEVARGDKKSELGRETETEK